jgi:hypothetical protein
MAILYRSSCETVWLSAVIPLPHSNGPADRHSKIQFHEGDGIMLFCAMSHVNIVNDVTIEMGMMLSWEGSIIESPRPVMPSILSAAGIQDALGGR